MNEIPPGLAAYAGLVRAWAPRLDLVSPADLDRFEERHIEDSLRITPLLEDAPDGPCVDVGSGAGLPGIPLAIAVPGRVWRLLEPRLRRAAFLEEAVRALGLRRCEVLAITAEEAGQRPDLAGSHAFATARALAAPEVAADKLTPLLQPNGRGVIFLGENATPPAGAGEWRPGLAIIGARHTAPPRAESGYPRTGPEEGT